MVTSDKTLKKQEWDMGRLYIMESNIIPPNHSSILYLTWIFFNQIGGQDD